jgi:hypothetical protein
VLCGVVALADTLIKRCDSSREGECALGRKRHSAFFLGCWNSRKLCPPHQGGTVRRTTNCSFPLWSTTGGNS